MMKKVKIGFLPLYLKLYDDRSPGLRPGIEAYRDSLTSALEAEGAELVVADICRIDPEFRAAVARFEAEGVDAIVTVHLAYSPSLECIGALAATSLPLIILDTTRDYDFGFGVIKGGISYNHGIHGVQDLCNLLRRHRKDYTLFVGHFEKSDVTKRVVDAARAVVAAQSLDGMKVGQVGGSFAGMGDFLPSAEAMERLGVITVPCDGEELARHRDAVGEEELRAEYERDCAENGAAAVSYEDYAYAERIGLAVRRWIDANSLGAFTMTFLSAGKVGGFDTMPFSESSKAMARGIGYAGEGDVLTAALVGALSAAFDKVNFTEMFCPDWKGGAIYMSHMGESNLRLLENRKTVVKPFPYADGPNPTCILGHMIAGQACVCNLLPNADGWFDLVICEGEMLKLPEEIETLPSSMNGWWRPKNLPVASFLERYSELGGTHHSALVYGVDAKSLSLFAKTLGMTYTVI